MEKILLNLRGSALVVVIAFLWLAAFVQILIDKNAEQHLSQWRETGIATYGGKEYRIEVINTTQETLLLRDPSNPALPPLPVKMNQAI